MNAQIKLGLMLPMGGPCSPVFFRPAEAFFQLLEPFKDRVVVDVGAGKGHVVDLLLSRGFKAFGIDTRTDEASSRVLLANALNFRYPSGSIAIICRPCHSALFVEPAIQQMVKCGISAVFYVGSPKNSSSDLGSYRRRFKKVSNRVGMGLEAMYLWEIV